MGEPAQTPVRPPTVEPVKPGRDTGLYDMDGVPLFDGDIVVNYNAFGLVGEVRHVRAEPYVYWSAAGASIGNRKNSWSSSKTFGVRLLGRCY